MSNQFKKKEKESDTHSWEKVERKLPDGFSYYYLICKECHLVRYPGPELQKIQDYSKKNLFLSVRDWILLFLHIGESIYIDNPKKNYIAGITRFQKMLFLIFYEFAPENDIPTENPGFYGYKYGPYSDIIDEAIDFLISNEDIIVTGVKSSSKEKFSLTDKGNEKAKNILSKLTQQQRKKLVKFRLYWDQKTTKGLLKRIYSDKRYSSFLDKSIILDDLFPGRKLYRRRG